MTELPSVQGQTVYGSIISQCTGRALSLVDSEVSSPSYGSFDRTWWCWKFTDFSAPRFQEGVYFLGWLAKSNLVDASPTPRRKALELAEAGLQFWCGLQHRDGSFDEAYPFERSLAATAFTSFYLGLAFEKIAEDLHPLTRQAVSGCLKKSGMWLSNNGEHHGILSNHLAAAAAACQVIGDVLKTDQTLAARDRFLDIIYQEQDPEEGWLSEYGGADPGYQSHGMYYLAEIWKRTHDTRLLACLKKACDFCSWFAHPDGAMGGEYSSRGTQFFFPAGFEILAKEIESAAAIVQHFRKMADQQKSIGPMQMDAWNFFPMLNNYIIALENMSDVQAVSELPWQTSGVRKYFPNAGLCVGNAGGRKFVTGIFSGGTLKLWSLENNDLIYEDCGYLHRYAGKITVSQTKPIEVDIDQDNGFEVRLAVRFSSIPTQRFTPYKFLMFRLFTTTAGRLPGISRWLKKLLVRTLIYNRKQDNTCLHRTIHFTGAGQLSIVDRIKHARGEIKPVARQVPFHMGSSRYVNDTGWPYARVRCQEIELEKGAGLRSIVIEAGETEAESIFPDLKLVNRN